MATRHLALPGEDVFSDSLPVPSNPSGTLTLGPGLRHIPPSTITPTTAGALCTDHKKNAVWVENTGGRYIPAPQDLVLATVHHSSTDIYHCTLTSHATLAQLPQLAFEGATKKSRPQLSPGSLIYARVTAASKHLDPEIMCYNPSTGKGDGLGELKGGMVFDISLGSARRLLMARQKEDGGMGVLEDLMEEGAGRIGNFEVAVGRNGRLWVRAASVRETILVGRAVQTADREGLGLEGQRKMVRRLLVGH